MEKITLIGRLGRDASVKETQQGTKFLTFTMACDAYVRGENRTHWYDVTSFDPNRYKNMLKYLTKGSSVTVVGDLDADIEEGRDGVVRCRRRVSADSVQFTPTTQSGSTSEDRTETKPSKKRGSDEPDDIDEEEVTTTRRSRRSDDEEDVRPSRSRREEPEEYEEEEEPKPKRRSKPAEDDEDEPKPKRRAEEEEDEPKPKRRVKPAEDEEEDEPKPKRRSKPADEDETDDLPF